MRRDMILLRYILSMWKASWLWILLRVVALAFPRTRIPSIRTYLRSAVRCAHELSDANDDVTEAAMTYVNNTRFTAVRR